MAKKTKTTVGNTGKTVITTYSSVLDMVHDTRGVLKSVINQDNKYTLEEATVIGELYGKELTQLKIQLEVHKQNLAATKRAKKIVNKPVNNEVLRLQ